MNYVIIGNSTAAIGAVEGIRAYDREGSITLITSEPYHTYSRPLISYLLLGKTTEEGMRYREADFYEKNGCTLLLGQTATRLDPAQKRVMLASGKSVPYDKLLVATGSAPFVPPMEGLETVKHKTTFGSLDDAKTLEAMITKESRVLIVGAGLIGLKCAEGILDRVQSLTVVDLAPRVLSSILDDQASDLIRAHLEAKGIRFYLGQSVSAFTPDGAALTSGETIGFDVLVLAVGVRANTSLIKDAGGAVGRGITVNLHMETTLPDVYSAGDCTESEDCSTGAIKIMALLPNAYMQGKCAGSRPAGPDVCFDKAIPMNSIGLFGTAHDDRRHLLRVRSMRNGRTDAQKALLSPQPTVRLHPDRRHRRCRDLHKHDPGGHPA